MKSLEYIAKLPTFAPVNAEIAQLVEHNLAKVRVASSSLVFRSFQIKKSRKHCSVLAGFFCCMEVVVTVSVAQSETLGDCVKILIFAS